MAMKIFISYTKPDKDFALSLTEQLTRQGRQVKYGQPTSHSFQATTGRSQSAEPWKNAAPWWCCCPLIRDDPNRSGMKSNSRSLRIAMLAE
jgi:hypothetical protein